MGLVSTFTFTSSTETVTKDKLNNLVANLLTEFNGSIEAANIADSTITNAKIANSTIDLTTKVAGVLPGANQTTTAGTVTASEGVVVDANKDISGFRNVTATGSFIIGSADMNETDLEKLDGITNGTQAANKAVVADSNVNTGVSKVTDLYIGASGSEVQVTATPAEINQALDGVSANVTDTNLNTLTGGSSSDASSLHRHEPDYDSGWISQPADITLRSAAHGLGAVPTRFIVMVQDGSYVSPVFVPFDENTGDGMSVAFTSTTVYYRKRGTTSAWLTYYYDSSNVLQQPNSGNIRIMAWI